MMLNSGSRLARGHWCGWLFWGIAAVFFLYEQFVWVMPNVILVDLTQVAEASPVKLVWALSVYLWIYAFLQLFVGGLFDRFGTKFILCGATAICAASCLLFGTAHNLLEISVARGLSGFGSAFAFVGAIYVATVWFPPSRLALIVGITTAVGMFGQMFGQTPLVAAVEKFGWREVVVVCSWPGFALAGLILLVIPRRPSWFKDRFAKKSELKIGIFQGIVQVLSRWQMWAVGPVCGVLYLPLSVLAAMWGNTFMEKAGGYSAEQASFATIILGVGWLIGCPLVGIISDLTGSRKGPLLVGIVGGGTAMLLLLWPSFLGYGGLLAVMFVGGLFTSTEVVCFAVAMELFPQSLRGTAAACCNFITMMFAAGLQIVIGWILTEQIVGPVRHQLKVPHIPPVEQLPSATPDEFRWALAVVPALFLVALALCLLLPETAGRAVGTNDRKD